MNKFPGLFLPDKLVTERFSDTQVMLHREYRAIWDGGHVTVPAGFVNDLSSIPRALHWLIPKTGLHDGPSVIHDWLYHCEEIRRAEGRPQEIPRAWADDLFLAAMVVRKVNWPRRNALYTGVRTFGWAAWAT